MAKHKKKIIIAASVLLCALLLIVLFFVLKKRVFPSINDYQWTYEQEFIDEHDSDMVIDGKLDEARWSGQKWLTHSDNGVALKYTTVFTDYGLYIGAEVEDDDLQWNKRFNFARYTADCSNSAFHFRISHSDATTATTFNRYNMYVDVKDSASRNQTHHEAKATLNGELNPKDGKNKANKMTAELFVSWEALHLEDGKPEDIRIFPEYRYVQGESSSENAWIAPICYEEGSDRMFLSALFGKEGYINADKENALLGDSKTGMSKSDGWDVSKADKGQVSVNDYYQQNIFYKGIYSDAYIYSTTMKITGERENEVGFAGVSDTKDGRNLNAFYVDARGVLNDSESLTVQMMDYSRWTTHTVGTIPNKASYKTGVVLRQFSFTAQDVPQGAVLHQVSGKVTADTDAMRRFNIYVTDTNSGDIYVTKVDREGNFSIDLPEGTYKFIFRHSSQDKFFYPTPIEKNVIRVSQNMDNVTLTAKPITTTIGTFHCKLNIPLIDVEPDAFKLRLKHDSYGEFTVYRNLDGSFTTNAPVGNYKLSVKHKTESLFKENVFNVTIKKGDNNKTVTLRKNAINNGAFTFTENRHFESVKGWLHNSFAEGYGKAWMAELEMPELKENEEVGFVIHRYNDTGIVWGNWLRLLVAKGTDGKLVVGAQICADKTKDAAEINVGSSRVTNINANSVAGKKLQAVYKNGILTLRLDGQILNLYTNDTYLASYGKSTQVKNVLDFNGQLACGLVTNTKGMVIKDWAFTNVEKNVSANPVLNGTLKGKVQLSVNTLGLDQVRLVLHSKDGKMSFQTYANADGFYEIQAPVGEYRLEVANDGVAVYTPYEQDVVIRSWGTTKNIVLDDKNAINNAAFVLNKEGYFESTKAWIHNSFVNGYGDAWEANLTMPELQENEEVGFVIHRYGETDVVWGNWLRLLVARGTDGKLIVGAQLNADKTKDTPEINVGCNRVTDIDATSLEGKTLQVVFKDGVLTLRLDGQILNMYTNDTYLASNDKSTQIKDVLDLNGKLTCGLVTNTKGIIIKDWSFTNIKENVSDNPNLNGTLSGKVEHSLSTMGLDQIRFVLRSKDGKLSFQTYANDDGKYEIKAPAGKYQLTVSNDGVAAYVLYEKEITLTKEGTIENIVLRNKNAINNGTFTLNEEGYFESTTGFGHNCFVRGYGDAWEANLTMPELQENEEVGFVIHRYGENDVVWGNWLRLLVARGTDGKLIVGAQICADKTEDAPEINVGCSRVTDIDATSVAGKNLQAVFKNGILTFRLDGQILNLYTNDTYLASNGKSTQVKNVLDLDNRLACGLLTSAKGMVIKDWAFTNIKKDVSNNPKLNGTLSGDVTLNINTLGLNQVRFVLESEDGKTSFQTYANADGAYEIKAPKGKYQLTVSNDGAATYIPYQVELDITGEGTVHDVVLDKKNAINNETFVLTEDGDYKSNSNAGHNFFVNGYGNAWTADFTMTELKAGEAAGFVLHKQKADGSVDWDNWMRIYISKNADGTLDLGANMGDKGGYRLFRMSGNTVKDKVFRVTLLDGQLIISLDEKVLYKFKSDTQLVSGKATVGEILGLSNTSEIYCGLLAAPSGVVIKDWAFTNIPENVPSSPTYSGTLSGKVELSINTLGFDMVHLTLSNAEGTEKYSTYTLLDGTYEIKAPAGIYPYEFAGIRIALI